MRIFFLGDVVGRTARKQVMAALPELRRELKADFIVVNVENAAGGFGITPAIADEFLAAGADVMTTGNHVWDKREIFDYIDKEPRLIRPYNMDENSPGKGITIVENDKGRKLAVGNMMTNLFMAEHGHAFAGLKAMLAEIRLGRDADALMIDVHGEATSEKNAFGYAADGRATLVVGTHTHVPTADHRILPGGTAYMTDVGMCGDYTSVIGMNKDAAMSRFMGEMDGRLEVAKGEATLCGVIVDSDDETGLARSIIPFRRDGVLEGC